MKYQRAFERIAAYVKTSLVSFGLKQETKEQILEDVETVNDYFSAQKESCLEVVINGVVFYMYEMDLTRDIYNQLLGISLVTTEPALTVWVENEKLVIGGEQ
jgi:BioD-like phosphotransacetylase family protein